MRLKYGGRDRSTTVADTIRGDLTAVARAHSNIALVKYWGKRDTALNTPATGSISVTLDALATDTRVSFDPSLSADEFQLNDRLEPASRVSALLDVVRSQAGLTLHARVNSTNDFPSSAGLASSASGFAALALAASRAAGLALTPRELSVLARRGSGSAARSVFGGYVEMHAGTAASGVDSFAEQLLPGADWPLSVVVAITEPQPKPVSSTAGMLGSATTSPFYPGWLETADRDLDTVRHAIMERDFRTLGEEAEHSCLKLHSLMLTTRPALIYWNAGTMAAMHRVIRLREEGLPAYFTIDAGPQVKALCAPEDASAVAAELGAVPGVRQVRISALGPAAHLVDDKAPAEPGNP